MDSFRGGFRHRIPQYSILFARTPRRGYNRVHLSYHTRFTRERRRGYTAYCSCQWLCVGRGCDERFLLASTNVRRGRGKLLGVRLWDVWRMSILIRHSLSTDIDTSSQPHISSGGPSTSPRAINVAAVVRLRPILPYETLRLGLEPCQFHSLSFKFE